MGGNNLSFGDFIRKKREKKEISLREMARRLGIAAPYLSAVEKDRCSPLGFDKQELLAELLFFSEEERIIMLDLACKRRNQVPPDLSKYIIEKDRVRTAICAARDLEAGDEEWDEFIRWLRRRREANQKYAIELGGNING